jgi:hypothetical protein
VGVLYIKESTFSTVEIQRQRATCRCVVWYHGEAIIFGYLKVYGICVLCRTRFSAASRTHAGISVLITAEAGNT